MMKYWEEQYTQTYIVMQFWDFWSDYYLNSLLWGNT